jgi:hypothetical protein
VLLVHLIIKAVGDEDTGSCQPLTLSSIAPHTARLSMPPVFGSSSPVLSRYSAHQPLYRERLRPPVLQGFSPLSWFISSPCILLGHSTHQNSFLHARWLTTLLEDSYESCSREIDCHRVSSSFACLEDLPRRLQLAESIHPNYCLSLCCFWRCSPPLLISVAYRLDEETNFLEAVMRGHSSLPSR